MPKIQIDCTFLIEIHSGKYFEPRSSPSKMEIGLKYVHTIAMAEGNQDAKIDQRRLAVWKESTVAGLTVSVTNRPLVKTKSNLPINVFDGQVKINLTNRSPR